MSRHRVLLLELLAPLLAVGRDGQGDGGHPDGEEDAEHDDDGQDWQGQHFERVEARPTKDTANHNLTGTLSEKVSLATKCDVKIDLESIFQSL